MNNEQRHNLPNLTMRQIDLIQMALVTERDLAKAQQFDALANELDTVHWIVTKAQQDIEDLDSTPAR